MSSTDQQAADSCHCGSSTVSPVRLPDLCGYESKLNACCLAPSLLQCAGMPVYRQSSAGTFIRSLTASGFESTCATNKHRITTAIDVPGRGAEHNRTVSVRRIDTCCGVVGSGARIGSQGDEVLAVNVVPLHLPWSSDLRIASALYALVVASRRFAPGVLAGAAIFDVLVDGIVDGNVSMPLQTLCVVQRTLCMQPRK